MKSILHTATITISTQGVSVERTSEPGETIKSFAVGALGLDLEQIDPDAEMLVCAKFDEEVVIASHNEEKVEEYSALLEAIYNHDILSIKSLKK